MVSVGLEQVIESPTAMLFNEEAEEIVRKLIKSVKERGPESIQQEVTPEDLVVVQNEYERIGREGEIRLESFVQTFLMTPLRNKHSVLRANFTNKRKNPAPIYTVTVRCPKNDRLYSQDIQLTSKDLKTIRSLDDTFSDRKIECGNCNHRHDPVKTFMMYDLGLLSYNRHVSKKQTATNDLTRLPRTKTRQRAQLTKIILDEEKVLKNFETKYDVLAVLARVKGTESFVYKLADRIWNLDEIIKDPKKITDTTKPTIIKDYLGAKVVVTDDESYGTLRRQLDAMVSYSSEIGQAIHWIEGTLKDQWGEPRIVKVGDKQLRYGRKEDKDGNILYEGFKRVLSYFDAPIELQIQTSKMRTIDTQTHGQHHEELMDRRHELNKKVSYWDTVYALRRALTGMT